MYMYIHTVVHVYTVVHIHTVHVRTGAIHSEWCQGNVVAAMALRVVGSDEHQEE